MAGLMLTLSKTDVIKPTYPIKPDATITYTYTDKHNDSKKHHFAYFDGCMRYQQTVNGAACSGWVPAVDTPYYIVYHVVAACDE